MSILHPFEIQSSSTETDPCIADDDRVLPSVYDNQDSAQTVPLRHCLRCNFLASRFEIMAYYSSASNTQYTECMITKCAQVREEAQQYYCQAMLDYLSLPAQPLDQLVGEDVLMYEEGEESMMGDNDIQMGDYNTIANNQEAILLAHFQPVLLGMNNPPMEPCDYTCNP